MTRILYFSRDYTTHDHRFLTALSKTAYDVAFLQLERRGHVVEDRPLPSDIQLIPWIGGRSPAKLMDGPRLLAGLRSVIRDFKPDIIQAGPIQRSAFLAALSGFKPIVTMSWGYDLLHDVNRGRAWKWATKFTLNNTAALVGDCKTIHDLAVQLGMNPSKIVTFPWGANIKRFTPNRTDQIPAIRERLGWDRKIFVLLSVRSWAPIYGVDNLAKAFVKAANQKSELRLLMLGNGPLAANIRSIFQQGGVMDQVHIPGQVSQAKLSDFYKAADLYISTSHSDGTSISMLEAFASGIPVLLSDIPGNKEWVSGIEPWRNGSGGESEAGWLFRDGDVDSLTRGILYAVENRQQLSQMGQAARHLSEVRGDWEKNFPELFKAYEIALS